MKTASRVVTTCLLWISREKESALDDALFKISCFCFTSNDEFLKSCVDSILPLLTVDINFASKKRFCPFFFPLYFAVSFSFTLAVELDQVGQLARTLSVIRYDTTLSWVESKFGFRVIPS